MDEVARLRQHGAELSKAGRVREAIEVFDRAIALRPEDPVSHIGRALALLLAGDLLEGFREYEWRRKIPQAQATMRSFDAPIWDGSDPRGKTILLHAEQGIGDAIQFVRYASLMAERGARVMLEVPAGIEKLVATVPGVEKVFERGDALPAFDAHETLMSLPFRFGTTVETVPAKVPYVFADDALVAQWEKRLSPSPGTPGEGRGEGDFEHRTTLEIQNHPHPSPLPEYRERGQEKMRIGIVWAGNPQHPGDVHRSIPVEQLTELFELKDVKWISLQKGAPAIPSPLHDFGNQVANWLDTAAIIQSLDLVISVDTAVAHLAGAMGRPTWVMLGHQHDFRWMVDRLDSPWYPTMRLFRQPAPGDWANLVKQLRHELQMHLERR